MRQTIHRTRIIEVLQKGGVHTAKSIHERLGDVDLATVYRNLKRFVEEGIVQELPLSKDTMWYEFVDSTHKEGHHHAVCGDCGKVLHIHVNPEAVQELLQLDKERFTVDDVQIIVRGRCA